MREFRYLSRLDYPNIRKAVGSLLDGGGFLNRCGMVRPGAIVNLLLDKLTEMNYWLRIDSELKKETIVKHVRTMENAKRRNIEATIAGLAQMEEQMKAYKELADNLEGIAQNPNQVKIEMFEEILRWQDVRELKENK